MPARIQPNRPYYPRLYLPHPRQPNVAPASARAGRGGAGAAAGGLFNPPNTSPTGNVGGDLAKAIMNTIQQNRQNAMANRLMNTENPPRAGWVGGTAPAAGVPTTGTAPTTGGVQEMQFQQQLAADAAGKQQQDLADQLQKAKIASELALAQQRTGRGGGVQTATGNARRWQDYLGGNQGSGSAAAGKKAGKPPPYEPGSIDPNTDPNADKFPVVQADFDAQYGKGMYSKVMSRLPGTVADKTTGNYIINDANGNPIITLPAQDANYWLARVNAARVRSGQQPILNDKFPSANPTSGQAPGSQVNPYKPSNQLEARSLPYNSFFIDPASGAVGQKLPEQAPAEKKTSQADTGDGQGLLASSADLSQPDQPANMSVGVGSDQTDEAVSDVGSADLADAIARTKTANALGGIA